MNHDLKSAFRDALGAAIGHLLGLLALAVLSVIGIVYLLGALQVHLAYQIGPVASLLVIGVGLLLVVGFVGLFWLARRPSGQASPTQPSRGNGADGMDPAMMMACAARDQMREHPKKSIALALVGGAVLGANPRLARGLVDWAQSLDNSQDD